MSIVVRTLSDQVFDLVRERILSGQIPPLAPIRQEALAQELGISKIPLREALARLEQDGLLVSQANRGFFAPPLTREQAQEIFALRLRIEPDAAATAATVAGDADRDAVIACLRELEQTDARTPQAVHLNRAFHVQMVAAGGRPLTTQLVERLHVLAERYVRVHLEPKDRPARAEAEHRTLLDAWLARDAAAVCRLLHEHIGQTLADLESQLDALPPGQTPPAA